MTAPRDARPEPRWSTARVARPARDLARSVAFYRDLLGLPRRGGFTGHEGYDGVFFALPGGAELELTAGPATPATGTEEDLLVLYAPSRDRVREIGDELEAAGVRHVPAANPYWERWGRTFLDPDGYRVVIAAPDTGNDLDDLSIQIYDGPRDSLRWLFALAEDSPSQLDSYLATGRVLVAITGDADILGHLQLVAAGHPGHIEINNMAVREDRRGRGVGGRLLEAAADLVVRESATLLVVATATADIDNLRFYQRHGFRLRSVERDAFTSSVGYPAGARIDGIDLRDRVWLDREIGPVPTRTVAVLHPPPSDDVSPR